MKPLEMLVNSRGPILSQLLLLSISITDTFVLGYGVIGLGSAFALSEIVGLGNEGVYIGLLCGFAYSMIALLFDNKDIVKAEKLHGIIKFGR